MNTNNNENTYCFIVENKYVKQFQGINCKLVKEVEEISKVNLYLYEIRNVDYQVCKIIGPDVNVEVALAIIKKKIPQMHLDSVIFTPSPVSGCEINQEIRVRITSFLTPAHFYVQVSSYSNYTVLDGMHQNLNATYNQQEHFLTQAELKVKSPCAILHDGNWYRGTIVAVGTEIVVRLLDYGRVVTTTTKSDLRKLLPAFHKVNFQAIECKLENLKSHQGEWSEEARDFMKSVSEKPNKIKLKSFDVDGTLMVELFAGNMHYDWTSINAKLINKKLASFIVHPLESTGEYESQVRNHDEAQKEGIYISIGSEFLSDVSDQTNFSSDSYM